MLSSLQQEVVRSMFIAMRPIARFLLRAGIGSKQFTEIARAAFVDVASSDFGVRGRPTNVSRVSAMTGVSRKDVKRIREELSQNSFTRVLTNSPSADILHFWHTDPRFTDEEGLPRSISFADGEHSFVALAKLVSGDIPPGALKTELLRVGAIEETSEGMLNPRKRYFADPEVGADLADNISRALATLADTIYVNDTVSFEDGYFDRTVYNQRIDPAKVDWVRAELRTKLAEMCVELDDWLASSELPLSERGEKGVSLGVGIYYYQDEKKPAK